MTFVVVARENPGLVVLQKNMLPFRSAREHTCRQHCHLCLEPRLGHVSRATRQICEGGGGWCLC